jgi:hypothetical protein
MSHSRIWKAPLLAVILVLVAAACSSSGGSKADGDKTAFCKTNSEINAELTTASSAEEALAALKKVQGKFDAYVNTAPSAVKTDAQLQVSTARSAIDKNDANALNDPKLAKAGENVDSFCGVKSSSSNSGSSSDSSATDSSTSDAQGSAATCTAFADIQSFSQVSAEVATQSWSDIQALFASKKDQVAAAYDKIAASAPDSIAADVRLVAKFTAKLIDAAATASSPQEWGQIVASDPDTTAAGEAATRMGTFAQTECGIDPAAASS